MDKPTTTEVTSFTLNGSIAQVEPLPGERLSYALRERLDRKDVKIGCNAGDCGACTVMVRDLDGARALNACILFIAAYAYRSFVGAFILLVPVNLANFIQTAVMHVLGIGLDINSVMVAVIGVGVGIDYGIYLLSRICEEYTAHDHDWGRAITAAMTTTGKAIMFTASIMFIGILPWYFLSDLKFMADMGLLLVAIMLINMVLALVVLPLLVWLIKPKFAAREDLIVGESIDLSKFIERDPPVVAAQGAT